MPVFHKIVVFIGSTIILISFILALGLRKKGSPRYFSFFYTIPLTGLLLSVNSILDFFIRQSNLPLFYIIQNSLNLIDFILVSFLFYSIFKSKKQQNSIAIISILTFLGIGAYIIVHNITHQLFEINALANIAIFIFCLLYYFGIFNSHPSLKLSNEPSFWLATGLFLYATVNLPLYAAKFLLKTYISPVMLSSILPFANIFIIVKHLFFIKAYFVAKKPIPEINLTEEAENNPFLKL